MSNLKITESDIEISNEKAAVHFVRQSRFNAVEKLMVDFDGKLNSIKNYSIFGLAFTSEKEVVVGHIQEEMKVFFNGYFLSSSAVIVRRVEQLEGRYVIGVELLNSTFPVEKINQLVQINDFINSNEEKFQRSSVLPNDFRILVYDLARQMQEYSSYVNNLEQKTFATLEEKTNVFDLTIDILGEKLYELIKFTNLKLQATIDINNVQMLKSGFSYFRENLGQYIFQSPFTKRSYEKPRGYAGDFEMMNQLYRNDSYASTLFGMCVERAVNLHEEPTAVRNRSQYLRDKICALKVKEDTKILSVACGPAEEIKLAIRQLPQDKLDKITFVLLDQDEGALQYAQRNIRNTAFELGKRVNVELINRGVKDLLNGSLAGNKFNLIYSAGLFDYFSDPVATRIGRALLKLLDKGQLIVGNFNITSPNWFGMLALFDWNLILRSEEDLKRIFKYENTTISIESEKANVNLFCVIENG